MSTLAQREASRRHYHRRVKTDPERMAAKLAANAARRAAWTPEQRATQRQHQAEWHQKHRDRNRERMRAYYEDHKHDPDFRAMLVSNTQAYRARLRDQYVEHVDRLEVLRRHDGICGICHEPVDPTHYDVDHVHPIIHGGEHSYANTQPAHPVCNRRKGATWTRS